MINLTVKNTSKVIFEMRSIGQKVAEGARKVMHRAADTVEKEAKLNVPVDTFRLEEAIHQEENRAGPNGRLQIDVVVGGEIDGVNVEEYAAIIEQNYESYEPGEGTLEKRARLPGRYVGGHYMARAGETVERRLPGQMIAGIDRIVRTGTASAADDSFDEEAMEEIEG